MILVVADAFQPPVRYHKFSLYNAYSTKIIRWGHTDGDTVTDDVEQINSSIITVERVEEEIGTQQSTKSTKTVIQPLETTNTVEKEKISTTASSTSTSGITAARSSRQLPNNWLGEKTYILFTAVLIGLFTGTNILYSLEYSLTNSPFEA